MLRVGNRQEIPAGEGLGNLADRFALVSGYRFFNVMLIPKLSIMMNDVSRPGFLVMALM